MDKSILRIDHDDDDENYIAFQQFVENNTHHQKKRFLMEIEEHGDEYLKTIKRNKKLRKQKITKEIDYILSKTGEFTLEELNAYDESDVLDIYKKLKIENRPLISKMFHFLIGGN